MTLLLEHVLEVTALLTVGLVAAAVLRRRSAALRHAILASSLLLVPLVPATGLVSPAWTIPALDTWFADDAAETSTLRWLQEPVTLETAPASAADRVRARGTASPIAPVTLLAIVWFAGVAAGLLHLIVGMRRLAALGATSVPMDAEVWTATAHEIARRLGIRRRIDLRQSANPTLLVTWGLLRPRVIVPAAALDWPADRIRSVLGHELAHVRRGDWAVQIASEAIRIAYWFHPLAWVACRRLRDESEHACDDTVIDSGVAAQEYATHLFEVARTFAIHPRRWIPAAAIARPSTLERRIAAMLNADPNRRPARAWAPVAAVLMMGSVAVISAGFDADTTEPVRPAADLQADVRFAARPPIAMPAAVPAAVAATAPAAPASTPAATPAPVAAAPAPAAQAPAPQAAPAAGTSVLYGRIVDQSGAVLPGVEVWAAQNGDGEGRTAVTDGSGFYQLQRLSAGDYVVQTRLPGFRATRAAVAVPEAGSVEHSVQLDLGSLEETITVTGKRGSSSRPPRDPAVRTAAPRPPFAAPKTFTSTATPGAATAAPGTPVRVGGAIKAPAKVLDVRPVYPAAAQAAGLEGVVILGAVIGEDGSVKTVEVLRRTEPDMDSAAVEAVRGWKFTPTLLNGAPVPVQMTVTVQFTLQ